MMQQNFHLPEERKQAILLGFNIWRFDPQKNCYVEMTRAEVVEHLRIASLRTDQFCEPLWHAGE